MLEAEHTPTQTPSTLVVFGATGDLMARKLEPSLYHLFQQQLCPEAFAVVGIARQQLDDEAFRDMVGGHLDFQTEEVGSIQRRFLDAHTYHQGDFTDPDTYRTLKDKLEAIDASWSVSTNKLFYLAVPPQHYPTIFTNLSESGLSQRGSDDAGWSRILVEKPIGHSKDQALELERQMEELFEEEQIYRIDHYLGKEPLQNLPVFRFSNNLLEQTWDRESIERVDIKLRETIDVEDRGGFYDHTGALLDVGQNHMLQMLALTAMPQPAQMSAEDIRAARADILESLACPDPDQQLRGQYEGYQQEENVAPDSTTETYFQLRAYLDRPDWKGVPFYLESGKDMPEDDKRIVITYRHPRDCMCPSDQHYQNEVHVRLQPRPGIAIKFWSRKPGDRTQLRPEWLQFHYPPETDARYTAEYTELLLNALKGNLKLFVSKREHIASWQFIDPIVAAWGEDDRELPGYRSDTIDQLTPSDQEEVAAAGTVGIVGLGKMGHNIADRLHARQWQVVGHDPEPPEDTLFPTMDTIPTLAEYLPRPRTIWLMVPHSAVDDVLFGTDGLSTVLEEGDTVVDGGNSFYKESAARADKLGRQGIGYVDVGVSGGPGGARHGSSLMIGGTRRDFERLEQLFIDLAVPGGYAFFEGAGAGHFVKMVHNGIEYGMMQSIAEGFAVLKHSPYTIDVTTAADVYNHGSVIESRLLGWLEDAFHIHGPDLEDVSGSVAHTGEGGWTVDTAHELDVKTRVIEDALAFRQESENNPSYPGRILSALRGQFGGHDTKQ